MRKKFSVIRSAIVAWAMPFAIYAQGAPNTTIKGRLQNTGTASGYDVAQKEQGIYNIISAVINATLSLMGVIFLALIVYGGYLYMTAGGDESKVEKARSTITRAVIGLLIVILAYSIANFVVPAIYCASNPSAGGCTAAVSPDFP